jgi:DNA invertase Pin-like site-specific DNA recombinase
MKPTAVAYYRTSSATNVGEDKDSRKRQADAVADYAAKNKIQIVKEFYDADVKGADPVMEREGFAQMFSYMMGNGARTIFVETANRFARDAVVQITGYEFLKKNGIEIIPVDSPSYFQEDTPTAKLVRGVLAVVSEFEKDALVEKLRKARERKRRETGRCEGRKPVPAAVVQLARVMAADQFSLRQIGQKMADSGYLSPSGKTYGPQSVKRMLERTMEKTR